jgi:hypothetical protein
MNMQSPEEEGGNEWTFGVSESAWRLILLSGAPSRLRGGAQVSTKNIAFLPSRIFIFSSLGRKTGLISR